MWESQELNERSIQPVCLAAWVEQGMRCSYSLTIFEPPLELRPIRLQLGGPDFASPSVRRLPGGSVHLRGLS